MSGVEQRSGLATASNPCLTGRSIVTCSASSIPGIRNFGDELLTEIYHRWIRDVDVGATISHLKVSPVGPLSRATRRTVTAASCLLFTGGGYFADGYGSPLSIKTHLRSLRNRNVYWRPFVLAREQRVPCSVIGLEVGPIGNYLYRRSVREILNDAKHIVVRNEESRGNAHQLCGSEKEIAVHLDAAFSIEAPQALRGDENLRICLHLHTVGASGRWAELVERMIALAPANRPIRLFFLYDQLKRGGKPAAWAALERHVVERFSNVEVIEYSSPSQTVAELARMDVVVSSKLHVGIVARAMGIPILSVGEHDKIRRCFRSIGEENACGTPEDFLTKGLPGSVTASLDGSGSRRVPLPESARISALANRDVIRRLVGDLPSRTSQPNRD